MAHKAKSETSSRDDVLIAQITDLHLGQKDVPRYKALWERFEQVLVDLQALRRQPDILMLTGDLVEDFNVDTYDQLKTRLDNVGIPWMAGIGNHDEKTVAVERLGLETADEFVHYVRDIGPVRIFMLDTTAPNQHGGSFCERRVEWLTRALSDQPTRPTFIACHHPPIPTGIAWMEPQTQTGWQSRLEDLINKHANVLQIACGHVHRAISRSFASTNVSVCRSTAFQVKLELAPIDPDVPDGRPLMIDEPPGYALYHYDGQNMSVHHGISPEGDPLLVFDEEHKSVINKTMDRS
jgi:3',5'-cyclic AMP phosphodiesterase CpdA